MLLEEIISSISLIAVFTTVLFSLYAPKADFFINYDLSKIIGSASKIKEHFVSINKFIFYNWLLIILVFNVIVSWILTPNLIYVLKNSKINLFAFDINSTIYCIITIYFYTFTVISFYKLFFLIKKRIEIKKELNKKE